MRTRMRCLDLVNPQKSGQPRQSNPARGRRLSALKRRRRGEGVAEHSFRLLIDGDTERHLDALFEAGCDDATFGAIDALRYADFDRVARTPADAVASAIRAVESVPTLRVLRVEPGDLVTAAQIAARLKRPRASVQALVSPAGP